MHGGEKSELNVVMNYPGRVTFWHKMIDWLNTTYSLEYPILQEIAKIIFLVQKSSFHFNKGKRLYIKCYILYLIFRHSVVNTSCKKCDVYNH